ncbi:MULTISPECIES: GspE/PulE family protein [Bradyrhizobium]|uniref:General secretion pathway protein GspE n=3 Tax=Bradyrhizobium TaxID=374 RepID=A0A410VIH0_9BRAD|nr:type II/IV secretion system protein [Bradyrhizobium guangdongense]QAU50946.1 type II/IV secretion system protein [Bradyrhizobium guangzhouense]QOZ49467.1 type II/IV secretion system protein [Bradyrhizobium sp. CCBAU 53340]QOZ56581.1 type II/IV secretion system protein [Bradyrhizobium sp. CCBAU 53338]QOZ81225.1 type II/IV secretion system protein [Bradyrhizobium sp. CCBAU 53351]
MRPETVTEFAERLRGDAHVAAGMGGLVAEKLTLRQLFESSDLSAQEFADAVAAFFKHDRAALADLLAGTSLVEHFSPRFLREMTIFPYQLANGRAVIALFDPTDTAAISAAEIVLGPAVKVAIASFEDIDTALSQRLSEGETTAANRDNTIAVREEDIESLRDLASGAPVVRAVSELIEKAAELRASDIHIEPFRTELAVRMRVDGLLRHIPSPSHVLPQAIVSRIKILAGLNIAERRLPQDGAARVQLGRAEMDLRVAIMPTQHGESAVIRLLPKERGLLAIEKLGFAPDDEAKLRAVLTLPHGLIVVTGPTGSGKTTTLATVLGLLNESSRKILTIEDPVEYEIKGINQSQVNSAIGLTFAKALRAFVRQDPDVIMVGEIRDAETAEVAIHAALTGHLVLTTLHTETAAAAVPRLLDLGVEAFLLSSTLRAVIAQRLVRQLCDRCKTTSRLEHSEFAADRRYAAIGLRVGDEVYKAGRCERCGGTGYRGRVGLFEVLEVADEVRQLMNAHCDAVSIDRTAVRSGMTTMIQDGLAKCRAGVTSPAEVLRVTTIR